MAGGEDCIRTGATECLTFQSGLLAVYEVARQFEFVSLPETKLLSSEARKTTAFAISSGVPSRLSAQICATPPSTN